MTSSDYQLQCLSCGFWKTFDPEQEPFIGFAPCPRCGQDLLLQQRPFAVKRAAGQSD